MTTRHLEIAFLSMMMITTISIILKTRVEACCENVHRNLHYQRRDQDQNLYNEYFGEMPWLALPFKDARMKPAAKHFGVRGLPRLVVLNAKTGATLNADAG